MKTPYALLLAMVLGWTVQAQTVPVTFSVDMNNETVAAEGVHVAGNFQGGIRLPPCCRTTTWTGSIL